MYTVGGSYKGSEPLAMHAAMLYYCTQFEMVESMGYVNHIRSRYFICHIIHVTTL